MIRIIIILLIIIAMCLYKMRHILITACMITGGSDGERYSWKKKTDIYDKFKPKRRKTTRVTIVQYRE